MGREREGRGRKETACGGWGWRLFASFQRLLVKTFVSFRSDFYWSLLRRNKSEIVSGESLVVKRNAVAGDRKSNVMSGRNLVDVLCKQIEGGKQSTSKRFKLPHEPFDDLRVQKQNRK